MARTLIKAREGVHGRQVTDKERKLLQDFAKDYVESTPTRAAAEAASLKRLRGKMLLVESSGVEPVRDAKTITGNIVKARPSTSIRAKRGSAKAPAKRSIKIA